MQPNIWHFLATFFLKMVRLLKPKINRKIIVILRYWLFVCLAHMFLFISVGIFGVISSSGALSLELLK